LATAAQFSVLGSLFAVLSRLGRFRILGLGTVFFGSSAVWAFPPATACIAFTPERSEIEELISKLDTGVSSNITLQSACFTESLQLTGRHELEVVRRNSYLLSWPIAEVVNRVPFYRRMRCWTDAGAAPECDDSRRVAKWHDKLVSFSQNMTDAELVQVLRTADELLGQDLAVFEVEKTKHTLRGQRFTGEREYRLSSRVRNTSTFGHFLFWSCSTSFDCNWRITGERLLMIVN
jgi:hypothetical protein